jgi:hypothetical protein
MATDIHIGSIAVAPLIVALVQVAKGLGFPPKYAPWLNATLAVLFYALMLILEANPQLTQPVTIALNLLVTFLTAAGIYDIGKNITR